METVYRFPSRVAVADRAGRIVAGLPYAQVEDFRGARLVAYPFADVCEPLGDGTGWATIESALSADGTPWQIRSRSRPGPQADSIAPAGVHQEIPLGCTVDEALARCHPKQRANMRQAAAAGVTCRMMADDEGVELFYAMHARLRKVKHRLLPQPRRFFDELARRYFPERGFVLVAQYDHTPVAAMLFVREGNTWYYKFSASEPTALALRPNHFLLWRAVESAIEAGIDAIDLGISEDEGLVRFKQRFGARAAPVYVGKYHQVGKSPDALAVEATLAEMTAILTAPEAPLVAAMAGGHALYRYFA